MSRDEYRFGRHDGIQNASSEHTLQTATPRQAKVTVEQKPNGQLHADFPKPGRNYLTRLPDEIYTLGVFDTRARWSQIRGQGPVALVPGNHIQGKYATSQWPGIAPGSGSDGL